MADWIDEIKTTMNTIISDISSIQTGFIAQIVFKLLLYVFDNGNKPKDLNT